MKNSESEDRTCPVCNNEQWNSLIDSHTGRIMTGDQRIGPGKLSKVICSNCGVGANKNQYTEAEIETLYGKEYELNTYGREEHLFFTKEGPIPRSQVFGDWIAPHISDTFEEVIEIGCGEGMLLRRLQEARPEINFSGIDGSEKAVVLAQNKGLSVKQGLIHGKENVLPHSDCFLLINVIEHIENLTGVITSLKKALNDDGRLIFCLPIQDFGGYDIVFAEHVWHFTVEQFRRVLELNGLRIIHDDAEHPINHGIGLFVCSIDQNVQPREWKDERDILLTSWNKWKNTFSRIDEQIESSKSTKWAVFGSGEVLTLLMTFTKLGDQNIMFILDETPAKQGTEKHGIPIFGIDILKEVMPEVILVTTNPKYNDLIAKKFESYDVELIFL